MKAILLVLAILFAPHVFSQSIYKCPQSDGKILYQKTSCTGGNTVTIIDNGKGNGAINPNTGEFYAPAGDGYVGTRDGTYYAPAGPSGVTNTRTGQFIPKTPPPTSHTNSQPSYSPSGSARHSEGYYRCIKTGSSPDSCRRMYD